MAPRGKTAGVKIETRYNCSISKVADEQRRLLNAPKAFERCPMPIPQGALSWPCPAKLLYQITVRIEDIHESSPRARGPSSFLGNVLQRERYVYSRH